MEVYHEDVTVSFKILYTFIVQPSEFGIAYGLSMGSFLMPCSTLKQKSPLRVQL